MRCIVEFTEPLVRFEFEPNKHKQKILIDVLLKYSQLDLAALASTLEVSPKTLNDVHIGVAFLPDIPSKCLAQLFLILFSD